MVSKKKVLRDILIIAIVLVAVFLVWYFLPGPRAPKNEKSAMADMISKMPSNAKSEIQFETDKNTEAIKIDDKVFTIGQIDTEAKRNVAMMRGGMDQSGPQMDRDKARTIAIKMLIWDTILQKKASELGIEVIQKEIDDAFQKRVEDLGGMEKMNDLMKSVNVDKEMMMNMIRKDLLTNDITKAMFSKLETPKGENPESYQASMFTQWLEKQRNEIKVEALIPEMKPIVENLFKGESEAPSMPPP